MQSKHPNGRTNDGMGGDGIQVGDRVVGTQVPDVLTVLSRTGPLLELESDRGLRMRVMVGSVRKVDGEAPAPPKEE